VFGAISGVSGRQYFLLHFTSLFRLFTSHFAGRFMVSIADQKAKGGYL